MVSNSAEEDNYSSLGHIHVTYQVFEKSCLAKVLVRPGLLDVSSCLKAVRGKREEVMVAFTFYEYHPSVFTGS